MTPVELITLEKKQYVQKGRELLDASSDYLHRHCDEWNEKNEKHYFGLIQQSATNLNKAVALNDILIKLGVR